MIAVDFTLADIVNGLQAHLDLSENMLAQRLQVSRGAISGIKNGNVASPSDRTLKAIAIQLAYLKNTRKPLMINKKAVVLDEYQLRELHNTRPPELTPYQKAVNLLKQATEDQQMAVVQFLEDLQGGKIAEEIDNLNRTLKMSGISALGALIGLYIQRNLGLNDLNAGLLALSKKMTSNRKFQQKYLDGLQLLVEGVGLPEDYVPLLAHLARLLKDRDGQPFNGDVEALLKACGLLR